MNEAQALDLLTTDLDLDNWWIDLLGQAADFSTFDLSKVIEALPRTEVRAAQAIRAKLGQHLHYSPDSSQWYIWDGRVHSPCTGDGIALKVAKLLYEALCQTLSYVRAALEKEALKAEAKGAGTEAAKIRSAYDKGEISKHKRFRDKLSSDAGLSAVVRMLKHEVDMPSNFFDNERRWFAIENGVYDMDAVRENHRFELLPHDPARPIFRHWNISEDTQADYPALRKFLTGSISDKSQARFFGKAVALACMGAPSKTRTIVSLQGARRSGKSMINGAIQRMGKEFYAEPPNDAILAYGKNKEHARYPMRKARYVAFTEVTDRLDKTFVLKYTGGDNVTSEQKYVANAGWKPQGIIFMASNHGMNIDKSDAAIFERLAPIHFPRSFDRADPEYDETLEDKIVDQSSGFLEWMKASYLDYLDSGLDRSDSMEALKRQEAMDEDDYSVDRYLQDRIESGYVAEQPHAEIKHCVSVTGLFLDYQQWCETFRVPKSSRLGRGLFSKEMKKVYQTADYQKTRFVGLVVPSEQKV